MARKRHQARKLNGMGDHGIMRLVEGTPNPTGNIDQLFLLQGEGITAPVTRIDGADLLPERAAKGHLRIFHFNDLHNHLTDPSGPTKGTRRFSQMVKRVRDARALGDPVLFLSIGDDHTGTMLDELVGWNQDAFTLDPSYRAYSAGGIDATVLGNHEFDRGSALLARGIRADAQFPVLSANVHGSQHLQPGQDYFPGAIAIVQGLRVGLIGLTTHVETRVGQVSDPTLAVASPVKVLENTLPALVPLVDVVLIMSHCGYGDGAHKSGKAAAIRDIGEADFSLARAAGAITKTPVLVLGAHTHTRLNEDGLGAANIQNGVPIFQAECNGQFLGEIEMRVESDGWKIEKTCLHKVKPRNNAVGASHTYAGHYEQDADVDLTFERDVIAPILAKVETALMVTVAKVTTRALTFQAAVLERYSSESALVNFICDAIVTRLKSLGHVVDFALMNGATIQAGIEPGTLSAGDWFNTMPYADEVFITRVTSNQLAGMLQSNAKRLLRRDEFAQTDHTGFLARGFLHTSREIRYRINPGATAAQAKALDITFDRAPLTGQTFNVVMSTYLALGGFGERWNGLPISGGVPGDLAGYDLRAMPSHNISLVFRDEVGAQMRSLGTLNDTNADARDGRLQIIGPDT
ncbi:MAG: 5'-nucleotidase C-terminal domain-containing protein [Rhodobacteraceae bacterium]|nr:5'-nucleotidase C-terminal domain-containing protein [Paracoccaceae bacterium]